MVQILDVVYSGKVPLENIRFSKDSTVSILLGNKPVDLPNYPISVPAYLLDLFNKLITEYEPTPVPMQNLKSLNYRAGEADVVVNATNYDSATALRRVLSARNGGRVQAPYDSDIEIDLSDVARQIAMLGFAGILITPQEEAVLAKRARVQVSGRFQSYPGGNMGYYSNLIDTFWQEASEEGRITPEDVKEVYSIGLTRGMTHAGNPGFVVCLESKLGVKELKDRITPQEHDPESVITIRLASKQAFREDLENLWEHSTDNSNGSLVVLSAYLFGEDYFRDLVGELNRHGEQINVNNPFR